MLEKIAGIIVKTQDYGETHKIVTIFSKKIGKFAAIARGAKKPKSRMAAVTQPFIYGEFLVYVNKGLSTIQQGEIIDSLRAIREDIIKTSYAAYLMELTDKMMDNHLPDPYLFDQLYLTMQWVADNDSVDIPMMMYEMKLFAIGGFAPTVDQCVRCGRKELPFSFSIAEGGLLCKQCKYIDGSRVDLPDSIAKLLHLFMAVGLERIGTISVKAKNRQLLREILDAYYDQYGGYYLKTKRFLKQMDRLH
ncbi:DNA repair protein RecO [Virgibacillus alimentarius]|uniref:DNA repair protein RecO n=1 Tax=Virgibacillus alimentarius TaxID=698769 RepID=A0ABS4S808_9BACI|nr:MULTISPECIES: DNA repair protein RecO [Virgibacillus]MBP2256537.1 DNA repair protein RecO (recombination protein O) [Virgibacillus alimentarius]HLR66483.1 DNA repair protein RecO [Virgibacillus sp.]